MAYTKPPYRIGKCGGSIVADFPIDEGIRGTDDVGYYGGFLIAESVTPSNIEFIVTACNFYYGLMKAMGRE